MKHPRPSRTHSFRARAAGIALGLLCTPGAADAVPGRARVSPAPAPRFCDLGGQSPRWLRVPAGFCARSFARVPHARVLRFAPGGELFVAAPNAPTSGYGGPGPDPGRIALLADDDGDGRADAVATFLGGLDACHALLFSAGGFYYSVGPRVLRMDYAPGQRVASRAELVADLADRVSFVHWPRTLDVADDGTLYVSRGGDEHERCAPGEPPRGAILALDGSTRGRVVVRGLRNPIYLRCQRGRGACYANELTGDGWDDAGGAEKLIALHEGDDWGYPCCVGRDRRAPGVDRAVDCRHVPEPLRATRLHDTPFGLDFAPAHWPRPWSGAVLIAMHGQFVSWRGARVLALPTDPRTGTPRHDVSALDFATGWDDGTHRHGRPADVTFAPDGRLFVANDVAGDIVWIAPRSLAIPPRRIPVPTLGGNTPRGRTRSRMRARAARPNLVSAATPSAHGPTPSEVP